MSHYAHLDQLLARFAKENLAGCACAVAKNGEIVYEGYHGYADLDTKREMNADTIFRLFSMTKVIVCTAAMMLYERGGFLLNEPLHQYIPEFKDAQVVVGEEDGKLVTKPAENPILVKDAFRMTVGLPYAFGDSLVVREIKKMQQELKEQYGGKHDLMTELRALAKVPMAFEPGTRWMYGYGHDLVAGLIEAVSGKSLGQFLQDELFGPLGMKDTGYRYRDDIESRMVTCYNRDDQGKLTPITGFLDQYHQPDAKMESGGAGLYSTLRDYLKFTQMLANGGTYEGRRYMGRKTIDLMRTNHLDETMMKDFTWSYTAGYGYGLGVRTLIDQAAGHANSSLGEFGWTGAAGTWTSIDPSEGFSVVYMHQMFPNMEEYHHLRVRAAAYAGL